jgi:membrane protease YdiL (CAAX protease family)
MKAIEFFSIFILLPITFVVGILPKVMIIPALWVVLIYTYYILRSNKQKIVFDKPQFKEVIYVLKRYLIVGSLIVMFTLLFYQEKLFIVVNDHVKIYFLVVILYPLLSVIPQEIIFRRFFFYRYKIDVSKNTYMLINAATFGFVHCAFGNVLAVAFTVIGGFIFASTYNKTKSLSLVTLEHSLYGLLVFTIGLGEFFYHNNNFS